MMCRPLKLLCLLIFITHCGREDSSVDQNSDESQNHNLVTIDNDCSQVNRASKKTEVLRFKKASVKSLSECQSKKVSLSCFKGKPISSNTNFSYPYCTTFPEIKVEIDDTNMNLLREAREFALKVGVIRQDKRWEVDGHLVYEGKRYPATIRLKGDWVDHVNGKVWSMKFKLKDGKHILGMNRFSIQSPKVRDANQIYYNKMLQEAGVLAGRYQYINYTFNHLYKGIVALEESFSYELVENLRQRESVILTHDENTTIFARAFTKKYCEQFGCTPVLAQLKYLKTFRQGHVLGKPVLEAQMSKMIGTFEGYKNGYFSSPQTFDLTKVAKYLAISEIWRAFHGTRDHQLKFYYNAFTKLIEPIAHDGGQSEPVYPGVFKAFKDQHFLDLYHQELVFLNHDLKYGGLFEHILDMQKTLKGSIYGDFSEDIAGYNLHAIFSKNSELRKADQLIVNVNDAIKRHNQRLNINPSNSSTNLFQMNGEFNPNAPVSLKGVKGNLCQENDFALFPMVPLFWEQDGQLVFRLHNSLPSCRVDLEGLLVKNDQGKSLLKDLNVSLAPLETITVYVDKPYNIYDKYRVVLNYKELYEQEEVKAVRYAQTITQSWDTAPSLDTFMQKYPMFTLEGHNLVISGEHVFSESVVLPEGYDLVVLANSQLKFKKDVRVLVRGNLRADASVNEPISFSHYDEEGWGGIELVRGAGQSSLRYVTVEGVNTTPTKGVGITGAVSIYESKIDVSHATFKNITAEDGLNVVRSDFSVTDSHFVNLSSDAIDTDFSQGTFSHNTFSQVKGDGIDISGSKVKIEWIQFNDITDKAMSIGEASEASIENVHAQNVGIGISVKDQSHAFIMNSTIENASNFAFQAYLKKDQYKSCHIELYHVDIIGNSTHMVEKPCTFFQG